MKVRARPLVLRTFRYGNLFKSSSDNQDRTELVMLITPRLIEDLDDWQVMIGDFQQGLEYLNFKN